MAKYKLFRKQNGEWYVTNLYRALKALLKAGEPLRSKDLNWIVSSWHNFVPLMRSVTPDGDRYFDHKLGEDGGSYWSVSEEGYRAYVDELKAFDANEGDETKVYPKPDYLVNKVHTYEAEIEESVNLLKKHGYKLIKEGFHDVERELEDTISRLEDAGVEVISDYGVDGFSIMDTHGEKILVDRANHLEDYHVHYDSCTGDTVKCYELYDYIISNFGRALGLR